jgi:hypothetical protein
MNEIEFDAVKTSEPGNVRTPPGSDFKDHPKSETAPTTNGNDAMNFNCFAPGVQESHEFSLRKIAVDQGAAAGLALRNYPAISPLTAGSLAFASTPPDTPQIDLVQMLRLWGNDNQLPSRVRTPEVATPRAGIKLCDTDWMKIFWPATSFEETTRPPDIDAPTPRQAGADMPVFTITLFESRNRNSISKHIEIGPQGTPVSDGACTFCDGTAKHYSFSTMAQVAELMTNMPPHMALATGRMRADVGDEAQVVADWMMDRAPIASVSRTMKWFGYRVSAPALMLCDFDRKAMPPDVEKRLAELGGFEGAMKRLIKGLEGVARIVRKSTSAGLYDLASGKPFNKEGGLHLYIAVKNGADIRRALKDLHKRAWLLGLGWIYVGAAGQMLVRSIIDIVVGSPERLNYEGTPTLGEGLGQHLRIAAATEGRLLDTEIEVARATAEEAAEYERRVAAAKREAKPKADKIVEELIERDVEKQVARGVSERRARAAAKLAYSRDKDRVLSSVQPVRFDDPAIGTVSVGDILLDPKRFDGETCCDPLEEYGPTGNLMRNRAVVVIGAQHGDVLIYSQLHGGYRYILRHDRDSIEGVIDSFADGGTEVVAAFVEAMVMGGADSPVSDADEEGLIARVQKKAKIKGKKAITKPLKEARNRRRDAEKEAHEADHTFDPDGAGSVANGGEPLGSRLLTVDDFFAYSPRADFIYRVTGDHWPAASVDGRVPPIQDGTPKGMPATEWLHKNRAVEQITWAPGEDEVVKDRVVLQGGWTECEGARVYNSYKSPTISLGDPNEAGKWVDHVRRIYPDDSEHVMNYFAFKAQRPGEKINHALILGGSQGIGKDTMLEGVCRAVGAANWQETTPKEMLNKNFTEYRKAVILRINEVHDLGEHSRYEFYDHMKDLSASGPFALTVREMYLSPYYIPNVLAAVMTTNHRLVFHIPPDDRRNYFAWGVGSAADFPSGYFDEFYRWYENGGYEHVVAFLMTRDLSNFDPKAPPPKTPWF